MNGSAAESTSNEVIETCSKSEVNEDSRGNEELGSFRLSKNEKRLLRKEKFDRVKVFKRKHEREKRKQRYAQARELGITLGPSRKALKRNSMKDSIRKETIVIDCDFDDYMAEKDIVKLVSQIQRCYSINRRFDDPIQFHVTGVGGQTKARLESVGDFRGWDIYFTEQSYTDVFAGDRIVYLTSESDQVLTDIKSDEVYVIGGLVDHNHHKGLCHRLAVQKGIRHARLPIDEYVKMQTRRVLTIDQVFNILGQYLLLGQWEQAFYEVIPKRKGAAPFRALEENAVNTEKGIEQIDEKGIEEKEHEISEERGKLTESS